MECTAYTQKNGAVSIAKTIETAPLFCVYPVYMYVCMYVQGIHKRMVLWTLSADVKPHHSFVYALYVETGV